MRAILALFLIAQVACAAIVCPDDCNTRVLDQDGFGSWIYAVVAWIERAYCQVTCARVYLSIDRARTLSIVACEEFNGDDPDIYAEGIVQCTFEAFDKFARIAAPRGLPIRIRGARRICADGPVLARLRCASRAVLAAPIIATMCEYPHMGPCVDGELPDTIMCDSRNHAVLITHIDNWRGSARVTFQNSRGRAWGVNGTAFVTISSEDIENDHDPLLILDHLYTAELSVHSFPRD
jgi:hypothetical protein